MSALEPIVAANLGLLRQATRVIGDLADAEYNAVPEESRGGGVGAQFRHVMDMYGCLLEGLEEGRIDYDRRSRDQRVEQGREAALARLDELTERVGALAGADPERELLVVTDREDPDRTTWSRSTFYRELRFLQSHTIHHFALIGWMLRSLRLPVPGDFGLAPSTRSHWARLGKSP